MIEENNSLWKILLAICFASVSASIVPSQQRDDGQASTTVEDDALWSPDFHLPPFGPKSKSSTHLDRSEDGEVLLSEEEEAAALALARRPEYQQVAAFVSVKVYFTEGYERESGGDVQRKVQDFLSVANHGYSNSGVLISLYPHCLERYAGEGSHSSYDRRGSEVLNAFTRYKGSVQRLLGGADIAVLLVDHFQDVGGIAWLDDPRHPVAVLAKDPVERSLALGHEIGHIMGAEHDRGQLSSSGVSAPLYPYGTGFLLPGTGKRTIMAYDPGSHPVQINYFSSSSVLDGDYDSTGDGSSDVARLLNERRFLFAAIGDEDKECSPNYEPEVVDGEWSNWSGWSHCKFSGGVRRRRRACDCPRPIGGGLPCHAEGRGEQEQEQEQEKPCECENLSGDEFCSAMSEEDCEVSHYSRAVCRKRCSSCLSPSSCFDTGGLSGPPSSCPVHSAAGHCTNPDYAAQFAHECPLSCGHCIDGDENVCDDFLSEADCRFYGHHNCGDGDFVYLCRRFCGECEAECEDQISPDTCSVYLELGYCSPQEPSGGDITDDPVYFMAINCARTCGRCT